jgi:hypothetical protein
MSSLSTPRSSAQVPKFGFKIFALSFSSVSFDRYNPLTDFSYAPEKMPEEYSINTEQKQLKMRSSHLQIIKDRIGLLGRKASHLMQELSDIETMNEDDSCSISSLRKSGSVSSRSLKSCTGPNSPRLQPINVVSPPLSRFVHLIELVGVSLQTSDGSVVSTVSALFDSAVLGLFFAASWCAPSRNFATVLCSRYSELKAAGKKLEIVLVSADDDVESFSTFSASLPYLALPFSDRDREKALCTRFNIETIPKLLLIECKTGKLITSQARSEMSSADFLTKFPFHPGEQVVPCWQRPATPVPVAYFPRARLLRPKSAAPTITSATEVGCGTLRAIPSLSPSLIDLTPPDEAELGKTNPMVARFGPRLRRADGFLSPTSNALLGLEVVGVYFSSATSRAFSPVLAKKLLQLQQAGKKTNVVFVSQV